MPGSDQRPSKRPRRQSQELKQETAGGLEYVHHPGLWFDDGNLVIAAGETAFKVYRGVLVMHSAVLEEKLAGVQMTYEGSPILVLDDPPEWVAEMLRMMFSLKRLPKQMELCTVFAYYELGVKYRIDEMREEGLLRLKACYPPTLDEAVEMPNYESPDRPIVHYDYQEFEIAAFAGHHALHSITPLVLYEACLYRLSRLRSNLEALRTGPQKDRLIDGVPPAEWVEQRILRGFTRLCSARLRMVQGVLDATTSKDPKCVSPSSCSRALLCIGRCLLSEVLESEIQISISTDLFRGSEMDDCGLPRPCTYCWNRHEGKWDAHRQKLWDLLPSYFDIPARVGLAA